MRHIIWRNRASAILGLLIMIMPFTGFPESLRTALIVLFGLLIVVFGFSRESASGYSYNQESPEISEPATQTSEELKEEVYLSGDESLPREESSFDFSTPAKRHRAKKKKLEEMTSEVPSGENQFDETEEKNS